MGGVARAELAAAVALAGGYGSLGMVRERPELISKEIDDVRARTDQLCLLKTSSTVRSLTFSRSGSGSRHRCFTCCTPYSRPPVRA